MRWRAPQTHSRIYFLVKLAFSFGIALTLVSSQKGREFCTENFHRFSQQILENQWEKGRVEVLKLQGHIRNELDTGFRIYNRTNPNKAYKVGNSFSKSITVHTDSWLLAIIPLIIFTSFALASSMKWRFKCIRFVLGLVMVLVFIFFRLWVNLEQALCENQWLEIISCSEFEMKLMSGLRKVFVNNVIISFLVPVLVWAMFFLPSIRSTFFDKESDKPTFN